MTKLERIEYIKELVKKVVENEKGTERYDPIDLVNLEYHISKL